MVESFPIAWPVGQQRTKSYLRKAAPFKTTMGKARDSLLAELKRLGAQQVVISSNVATYMRGGQEIMYADQKAAMEDPGVAVYFLWNKKQYCLACDKWKTVADNLQALMKTIDAIRGIERWGSSDMMKAAFSGFKPLPEPPKETKYWWQTLGVSMHATEQQIKEAYRNLAKIHHPDTGGSAVMFNIINAAYNEGLQKTK